MDCHNPSGIPKGRRFLRKPSMSRSELLCDYQSILPGASEAHLKVSERGDPAWEPTRVSCILNPKP